MAYKVFISSTYKDIELAHDLARRLEEAGLKVFPVEKSATPGDSIETTIKRELREANEVFVILTENSVNSPGLMSEMGAAFSLGKLITPVAIGVDYKELPPIFSRDRYKKWSDLPRYIAFLKQRF